MWFFILMCIPLAIIIIIVKIYVSSAKAKTESKDILKQNFMENNFVESKRIDAGVMSLCVDNVNKKFCVQERNYKNIIIRNFSDLTEFEILEDGGSIINGKRGGAVIGALAFGVVGAVVGGAGKRTTTQTCNSLQLKMFFNDLDNPISTLKLIDCAVDKNSAIYKTAVDTANEMVGVLSYIQKNS